MPCRLATDPELADNKVRASDRRGEVVTPRDIDASARALNHASRQIADDVEAPQVRIDQPNRRDRQSIPAKQNAIDELGGVRRSTPNNGQR